MRASTLVILGVILATLGLVVGCDRLRAQSPGLDYDRLTESIVRSTRESLRPTNDKLDILLGRTNKLDGKIDAVAADVTEIRRIVSTCLTCAAAKPAQPKPAVRPAPRPRPVAAKPKPVPAAPAACQCPPPPCPEPAPAAKPQARQEIDANPGVPAIIMMVQQRIYMPPAQVAVARIKAKDCVGCRP